MKPIKYYCIFLDNSFRKRTPKLIKIIRCHETGDTERFCRAYCLENKLLYKQIGARNRFLSSVYQRLLGSSDFEMAINQSLFDKLKKLWFLYGNNGEKHCDFAHKFLQGLLEKNTFYCEHYKKMPKEAQKIVLTYFEDESIVTY